MKSYVIERDRDSWVLRLFGRQEAMISGPTLELGEVREEWTLEHPDGQREKTDW